MTSAIQKNLPWLSGLARMLWPAGPARRKRWLLVCVTLLFLLALHTAWAVLASTRLMSTTEGLASGWGKMAPSSLAPPPVDDRDNAARAVRAATDMLALPQKEIGRRFSGSVRAFGSFKGDDPTLEQLAALRRVVADNGLTLTLLDEAAGRAEATWNLRYSQGIAVEIPDLLRLIDTARLNVVVGRIAVRDGDDDSVAQALLRGAALERSLALEPLLIVQLTRYSIQRFHVALLREWLTVRSPSSGKLDVVAQALGSAGRTSLREAFIGDAKLMIDGVLDAGNTLEPWTEGGNWNVFGFGLTWLVRPFVLDNARAYLVAMDRAASCAAAVRHEREPECSEPVETGGYHVLASVMLLDFAAAIDRADLAAARSQLGRLAVALERHRDLLGNYPDTLAALAERGGVRPDTTPAGPSVSVPLDRVALVDPLTGEPFAYERTERGYTMTSRVWSRHLDGEAGWIDDVDHDPVLEWRVER